MNTEATHNYSDEEAVNADGQSPSRGRSPNARGPPPSASLADLYTAYQHRTTTNAPNGNPGEHLGDNAEYDIARRLFTSPERLNETPAGSFPPTTSGRKALLYIAASTANINRMEMRATEAIITAIPFEISDPKLYIAAKYTANNLLDLSNHWCSKDKSYTKQVE